MNNNLSAKIFIQCYCDIFVKLILNLSVQFDRVETPNYK